MQEYFFGSCSLVTFPQRRVPKDITRGVLSLQNTQRTAGISRAETTATVIISLVGLYGVFIGATIPFIGSSFHKMVDIIKESFSQKARNEARNARQKAEATKKKAEETTKSI